MVDCRRLLAPRNTQSDGPNGEKQSICAQRGRQSSVAKGWGALLNERPKELLCKSTWLIISQHCLHIYHCLASSLSAGWLTNVCSINRSGLTSNTASPTRNSTIQSSSASMPAQNHVRTLLSPRRSLRKHSQLRIHRAPPPRRCSAPHLAACHQHPHTRP